MPELAGKLGIEQGQQASTHVDLIAGVIHQRNDGTEAMYLKKGKTVVPIGTPGHNGYPVSGAGPGATNSYRMNTSQHKYFNRQYNTGLSEGKFFKP